MCSLALRLNVIDNYTAWIPKTFLTDNLKFFSVDSFRETHSFNWSLISGLLWWFHVSSTVQIIIQITVEERQTLLRVHYTIVFVIKCCTILRWSFEIIEITVMCLYDFHHLAHFPPPIVQHHIINYFNCLGRSYLNWASRMSPCYLSSLSDVFFCAKKNALWAQAINFFALSPKFTHLSAFNGCLTQT